jgi:hypothetical protein
MLYSEDGSLDSLRTQLTMVLGLWHPFKVATDKLWTALLNVFWAPAIHSITPKTKIFRGAPLRRLTVFFTQCRLAYPTFRARLRELYHSPKSVPPEMWNHLQNLYHAFEFFIPVVSKLQLKLN